MSTAPMHLLQGRTSVRPSQAAPRWTGDGPRFVDELVGWLLAVGRRSYEGGVSLLAHSLQAAAFARADGAPGHLVVAALLHDVGHALAAAAQGDIGHHLSHDRLAASWLARFYPEAVTEPVRLHVAAKRWLVASEAGYAASLSPSARAALLAQGGPMSRDERRDFEALPHARAALALRRWDEAARAPGAPAPGLEAYRGLLRRLLAPGR